MVSIEMRTWLSLRTCSISGTTRAISSSAETGAAPGRVDSPPTSIMSTPSAISRRAWPSAASASRNRPPSEKLSGVTLTTPMTRGRSIGALKPFALRHESEEKGAPREERAF